DARSHLAARYADARRMIVDSMRTFADDDRADLPGTPEQVAPLLLALLVGLEMQHRLDPAAVPDATAVLGLLAITGLGSPPNEPDLENRTTP
ncbi:MAG TPA: hypothetical protein VIJ47_08965, partial [Acidimicrobiales bacterium]